ncbi:MAG: hypothetical protein AUI14_06715 [Actinobacteria bacterium 13_2_20CM_2_71_6]|nr:MAG: hypothetical protein AUI14_06715 [Actinobacteria bacterium 13_2_20CM_2_71_6]
MSVELPSADELPAVLLELSVPHEDIDDLVALMPSERRSPQEWELLERYTALLLRDLGEIDASSPPPVFPDELGDLERYFPVYVFLAALPQVRGYHRARGIPDDVSRLTLADLGRAMARHRRQAGVGGLTLVSWLALHFRGALYQLGRLQFQRARLDERVGRAVAAAGLPYGPGDLALSVHIPACFGPLSPSACDDSFRQAAGFFARHFPGERYRLAYCGSWLLDEQLAGYLSATSNIIAFQRRFRILERPDRYDDEDILRFVFGREVSRLDGLPRRTTLERAAVDHLRTGGHWYSPNGWLVL